MLPIIKSHIIGSPIKAAQLSGLGGGGMFSPLNIPGLVLWLDFSDLSTLFVDNALTYPVINNGDLIGGIVDKSGNGHNYTASTDAKKFTYCTNRHKGHSVGRSNNTANYLSGPTLAIATLSFYVVEKNNFVNGSDDGYFMSFGNNARALYSRTSLKMSWFTGSYIDLATYNNTAFNTFSYRAGNAVNTYPWVLTGASAATPSSFVAADHAEYLVYNRALTDAEDTQIKAYLSSKWGDDTGSHAKSIVTFGDSITSGTGASDNPHSWAYLLTTNRGWGASFINSGVSGTVLQNSVQNSTPTVGAAVDGNGMDNLTSRVLNYTPAYVTIMYGTNDFRLNDPGFTSAKYQANLSTIVDLIVANGTQAENIIITSLPYMNESYMAGFTAPFNGGTLAKLQAYSAAALSVSQSKGTKFADVYTAMVNGGGDSLLGADHLHPNNFGHALIAATVLTVI